MEFGRHRDDGEVQAPGVQQPFGGLEYEGRIVDGSVAVSAWVDRASELDANRALQESRVVAPHHAEADDGASTRVACRVQLHAGARVVDGTGYRR